MQEPIVESHPFAALLPPQATVMMMGTFPPKEEKHAMQFHYPNFQNDMWRVYGLVFFGDAAHFQKQGEKAFDADELAKKKTELAEKSIKINDLNEAIKDYKEEVGLELKPLKEEVKNGPKKLTLLYPANTPILEREALAIQAECKAVGVEVDLASLADAAYYKATKDLENKDYDIFLGGYVMGSDPDTFAILFSSEKDNNMNYHNTEIDKLFREGNSTLDLEKRKEIYNKVQRLVTEEAIYYPLGTNLRTLVTKKDVDPEEAQLVPIYTFGDLSKLKFK